MNNFGNIHLMIIYIKFEKTINPYRIKIINKTFLKGANQHFHMDII